MPSFFESSGLILMGLLPSLAWLTFYFREDCHPEPKALLARAFLVGVIISPVAILLQLLFLKGATVFIGSPESSLSTGPVFYFWAALVEEVIKFLAVYIAILRRPEFDEPIDAMIYMISAALGFAAIENILITFQVIPNGAATAITTLVLRFIGATLLHALASGILGYFLAVSWFFQHHLKKIIVSGIGVATVLHFIFNIIIASADSQTGALLFTTLLLMCLALFVSVLFDRLKDRAPIALFASRYFKSS